MLNLSNNRMEEIRKIPQKGFQSFKLVGTPRAGKFLAYWLIGIFTILLLSLFLPWTQNIRTTGEVTAFAPEDRPATIHSTIPGRIEKWYVQEGQHVEPGDTIVELSEVKDAYFNPEMLERLTEQIKAKLNALESTRGKLIALENQIKALKEGQQFSLSKARNRLEQTKLKLQSDSMDLVAARLEQAIAQEQFERQKQLFEKGLKSLTELEQRRMKLQETVAKLVSAENKFLNARNDVANARIEINALEMEYFDKISKAEAELNATKAYVFDIEADLSKMRNDTENLRIRQGFYFITAPQSGTLVRALKAGLGETIKEGEAVISIIPESQDLAVELFVKAMDIPLLNKGQKVRLQFDGWPALVFSGWPETSFGTFGGIVKVINRVGVEGTFRVLVVPDPNEVPWPDVLSIGSGVYGWALLKDVPIGYELWRQFNGFPPDMLKDNSAKINSDSKSSK